MKKHVHTRIISLMAILFSVITLASSAFSVPAQAASVPYASHPIQVFPHILDPGVADTKFQFSCQSPTAVTRCYSPQQIRTAYSVQPLLDKGITGKGRTIIIIDAFQSPTVQHDLDAFSKTFGIKSAKVKVIAPDGLTPFNSKDPNQVGWAEEISLDVQWSHVIAPDAKIDLVLAKSNQDADILSATKYAVNHNLGDVISQSFGEGEICADRKLLRAEHAVFEKATDKGMTLLASSGDQGAAQATCDGNSFFLSASTPASDPLVTGVGGTQLNADANTGKYIHEIAWNERKLPGGSGGGFSTIYKIPDYQEGTVESDQRGVPDVAYNAAVNGGVLTYLGFPGAPNGIHIFGGTSAGSPQWAGIIALADQCADSRLGNINSTLYEIGQSSHKYSAAFHDIRSGNNTFISVDAKNHPVTINGYRTDEGWDAVTGWGSPVVSGLLSFLD